MSEAMPKKEMLEIEPGISLAYVDQGPKSHAGGDLTLLLVPGFTFSSEVFLKQLNAFSGRYRVVATDPRSHGASTMAEAGNDYRTHAADLKAVIDHLDLQNIVLVGWSFGALATWGYLDIAGTGRVRAHVSVDMPPVGLAPGGEQDMWVEGSVGDMAGAFYALTSAEGHRAMIRDYIQHVMFETMPDKDELDVLMQLSTNTPHHIAMQLFAAGLFSNCEGIAKSVEQQIPSHFVIANHWAKVAVSYLNRDLPKSGHTVLGGHMMFWEYPDAFNQALGDFMQVISS